VDARDAGALPEALALLHRELPVGTSVRLRAGVGGRLDGIGPTDLLVGAGFRPEHVASGPGAGWSARATRERTLADTVAPGLRVLVCGLNPSVFSADAGVGFARPGNRFWPAAIAAGIASRDRDPWHALQAHRTGMTDLVKRATAASAALSRAEYVDGLARVERLVAWARPGVVVVVGLEGWRAAVDRRATAGPQPGGLAGRPMYLMPSTSGRNASSRLDGLVDHLRAAVRLADG
jgi:TDG/mug DNA glycosylase family protein